MNKDLFEKLKNEQPLTAEEALRLDLALESEGANVSTLAMGALPEDAPSLAWRSLLNTGLAKISRRRRSVVYLRYGFAAGAAAVACFGVVMLLQPSEAHSPTPARVAQESTIEDAIFTEHEEAMGNASLGVHVSFNEPGS